jgi:hypothetical protein
MLDAVRVLAVHDPADRVKGPLYVVKTRVCPTASVLAIKAGLSMLVHS